MRSLRVVNVSAPCLADCSVRLLERAFPAVSDIRFASAFALGASFPV